MVTVALPVLSGAVLCWPARPAARRLRALSATPGQPARRRAWAIRLPGPVVMIGLPALAAFALSGPGVGLATAVGALTARARWRDRGRTRRELAAAESLADAVQGLVTELRAGAHPVAAAEAAARDAREPAAAVLKSVAATARLGGELTVALSRFAEQNPALATALRPLVHAWGLAQRHGLPLADVLDSVRRDIAGRVRFAGKLRSRMAGPRASGTVLALLPVLGVLLGQAMDARPLHVLLATDAGQVLLPLGVSLACAGIWWIARLTAKAVRT